MDKMKIIQNLQDTHAVQWKYFLSLIYQGLLFMYLQPVNVNWGGNCGIALPGAQSLRVVTSPTSVKYVKNISPLFFFLHFL